MGWWVLFTSLIGLIPFAGLVTLIPTLAVTSRRFHDIGKSGWLQILPFALIVVAIPLGTVSQNYIPPIVTIIAAFACIVLLFVWLIKKGDEGPNKYGPDPIQPTLLPQ